MALKEVYWVGSSRKNILTFPDEVKDEIGFALYQAQRSEKSLYEKKYKALSGVMEIISNFDKEAYRAVYTFKIENSIYVLHCFHKKSHKDNKVPKEDAEIISKRYKEVLSHVRNKKK